MFMGNSHSGLIGYNQHIQSVLLVDRQGEHAVLDVLHCRPASSPRSEALCRFHKDQLCCRCRLPDIRLAYPAVRCIESERSASSLALCVASLGTVKFSSHVGFGKFRGLEAERRGYTGFSGRLKSLLK